MKLKNDITKKIKMIELKIISEIKTNDYRKTQKTTRTF